MICFSLFKHCRLDFLLLCGWKPLTRKANAWRLQIVTINQLSFERGKFCDVIANISHREPVLKCSDILFSSNLHLGHEYWSPPIRLSPVNYKIKLSQIKAGLEYTWMYFDGYKYINVIILNNWKSSVKTDIFSLVEFLKIVVTMIRYVLLTKIKICWHLAQKIMK